VIKDVGDTFKITYEDKVNDFLGINIEDGTILMTQPKLIADILDDLGLKENSTRKETPALSTVILQPALDDEAWNYWSVIGKLNYLERVRNRTLRTLYINVRNLLHLLRKCMRLRWSTSVAICYILGRWVYRVNQTIMPWNVMRILTLREIGIAISQVPTELHCDPGLGMSSNTQTCPLLGGSKLQTETALSATEAEYISLSTALREVIPIIDFLKELKNNGFHFHDWDHQIICKAIEDNKGALEMVCSPKFCPWMQHINIKYHHFHDAIETGKIKMMKIGTLDQQADIFTKPLRVKLFIKLRQLIMGWWYHPPYDPQEAVGEYCEDELVIILNNGLLK
jgi:hypothetical protein